jgi:uncharacterized protein GlcG (DUF336 family)
MKMFRLLTPALVLVGAAFATSAMATTCADLPKAAVLKRLLMQVATGPEANAGFGMPVWATLLNTKGEVCAVVHSLDDTAPGFDVTQEMSMGHRIFAIHKANTANAFSHSKIAIASASLYSAFQPGGALDTDASTIATPVGIFNGDTATFGTPQDPLIGKRLGGASGLGGGLALFNKNHKKVGAIGVSGDTVCTDHVIAWKIREKLARGAYTGANVPFGIAADFTDKMVQDIKPNPAGGAGFSAGSYGHATCGSHNPTEAQAAGAIEFHPDITGVAK